MFIFCNERGKKDIYVNFPFFPLTYSHLSHSSHCLVVLLVQLRATFSHSLPPNVACVNSAAMLTNIIF